jgi:DNA-binding response OmpR family regulator
MTQPDLLWRHVRAARREAPAGQPVMLLVDPDPEAQLLTRYALRHDATVDIARTAADAIRMATETTYDAVLVNLALPDAPGLVVLKRLRFRAAYRTTPITAITDHALPGDTERTTRAGFDACLAKPIEAETIRARITAILAQTATAPSPSRRPSESGADTDPEPVRPHRRLRRQGRSQREKAS